MVAKLIPLLCKELFSPPLEHCSLAPKVANIITLICEELFLPPLEQCSENDLAAVLVHCMVLLTILVEAGLEHQWPFASIPIDILHS